MNRPYYSSSGYFTPAQDDQRNPGGTTNFVPLILEIPTGIALSDISITFEYNWYTTARPMDSENWDTSPTRTLGGHARIWLENGTTRNGHTVDNGGDFVSGYIAYTAAQLRFTDIVRTITIYVEGITINLNSHTYEEINTVGKKTETDIVVKMEISSNTFQDRVKYVISKTDGFYYQLVHHDELRAALAAQGIYDREDLKRFCLQPLGRADLGVFEQNINVEKKKDDPDSRDINVTGVLVSGDSAFGFNAGVYHDYISGENIVTFQGTNPGELEDWWNNIQQYFGGKSEQYEIAANIGDVMRGFKSLPHPIDTPTTPSNWRISGHSLGGGLASAASVVSGVDCYTFNAAGLHLNSVKKFFEEQNPNQINIGWGDMNGRANELIVAYYIDWDILHFIRHLPMRLIIRSCHL